jgi:hypothetical protein
LQAGTVTVSVNRVKNAKPGNIEAVTWMLLVALIAQLVLFNPTKHQLRV